MKAHAPDAIIQTTRDPLSNQITSLLRLHEILIAVYVRDVSEGLTFNLRTLLISAEYEAMDSVLPTLQSAVELA